MPPRYGPALRSSDQELSASARITPDDLAAVRGWLAAYGPQLAPLLEAEPVEREFLTLAMITGLLAGGARYAWLVQAGMYYDLRRQRYVDSERVLSALDRALERAAQDVRVQTGGLRDGTTQLVEWELEMRRQVKLSEMAASMSAQGGARRTTIDALAQMQERVAAQYEYLRRYAIQMETGQQNVDGSASARSALYVRSARESHMAARQAVAASLGFDQVRTILSIADHCAPSKDRPGCVEEAERGWAPLGEMSLPGQRTCLGNCKCRTEYRNSQTNEVYGAGEPTDVRVVA